MSQWVYFDASALVKRYSNEMGTQLVNELFDHLPPSQMICFELGVLEIISILVRKRNDGRLTQALFQQALVNFRSEIIENQDVAIAPIENVLPSINFVINHNLNATDAVILRSALNLQ